MILMLPFLLERVRRILSPSISFTYPITACSVLSSSDFEPASAGSDIDVWDEQFALSEHTSFPRSTPVPQAQPKLLEPAAFVYNPAPLKYSAVVSARTVTAARRSRPDRYEAPTPSTLRDMTACQALHKVAPQEYGATPDREFGLFGFAFRTVYKCPLGDQCELRHDWFDMDEGNWAKGGGALRAIREMGRYWLQNEVMEA
jgi:hypothetical protein